jgi:hypothetical protein
MSAGGAGGLVAFCAANAGDESTAMASIAAVKRLALNSIIKLPPNP